ncbi:hypothetical protein [Pseudoneobacillus sp. C159]
MNIIYLECKKALSSPIILALFVLFSAWNILIIYQFSEMKEELRVVNQISNDYGVHITGESLSKLKSEVKVELANLNAVTQKKSEQSFQSANDFFNQLNYQHQSVYTDMELRRFHKIRIKEMYVAKAQNLDQDYASIDIRISGEREIKSYGLSGNAAEMLRKEYVTFAERFEGLKKNGEHKQWFFAGRPFFMHKLLFRTLFVSIMIEATILIVLSTALITNFEFENRTQHVTFVARRGRKLLVDKLLASLLSTFILTAFLMTVTLGTFFTTFDYAHLWKSAISSGLNWEYNLPYMSWWNFSFTTYLILAIVVSLVCILLFCIFTFSLSVMLKNSYYTVILFGITFIALFILPSFMPGSSVLKIVTGYNLSALLLNPHQWWMVGTSGLMMFKYYEVDTLIGWVIIFSAGCYGSLKKFARQDIV